MEKSAWKSLLVVGIYAVGMAFVESAVVVYLRMLYYPGGFAFPLKWIDPRTLDVEWAREAATLVMLAAVAWLAGKSFHERFAFFLWAFALWDIFYYVWLRAVLGWPPSPLTPDLLFLIPWAWVGPVLAPLLCSFIMIALALALLKARRNPSSPEWALLWAGNALVLSAFLRDYGALIFKGGFAPSFLELATSPAFRAASTRFLPGPFAWGPFLAGAALYLGATASLLARQ